MLVRKENRIKRVYEKADPIYLEQTYPKAFNILFSTSLSNSDLLDLSAILLNLREGLDHLNTDNKSDMFDALSKILV